MSKNNARQPPEFLAVGRIVRPHGIRGALRVLAISHLFQTLTPTTTIYLSPDQEAAVVRTLRAHKDGYLLFLEGYLDREAAERLRGKVVQVRFEDLESLPEGEYYHWEMIGLEVITEDGEVLGELVDILETGANDVYLVKDVSGRELLIPGIASVVLEVDLERSRLVVNLLPGLMKE